MKSFTTKTADFVLKYKWFIILANILLLVGLFVFGMGPRAQAFGEHIEYMKHIRKNPLDIDTTRISPPPIMNPDYHVFFEDDNPDLVAFDEFQRIYAKEENLIVVIKAKNGDIFTNENLASIREITDRSWEVPYTARVAGLANFNYTRVEREELDAEEAKDMGQEYIDNLLVDDFVDNLPYSQAELANLKQLAHSDPLLPKFLLSKKSDLTQITLSTIIPAEFPEGFMEARQGIERLIDDIQTGYLTHKVEVITNEILKDSIRLELNIIDRLFSNHKNVVTKNVKLIASKITSGNFSEILQAVKAKYPEYSIIQSENEFLTTHANLSKKPNKNIEIKLGGTVMLNTSFTEFAFNDMKTMIPTMFLIIILLLLFTLRSFWGIVLPMGLLITSVLFPVFLFIGVFEFYFTSVTINVIQILVAVAIADSVHILSVFYREMRRGQTKAEAIRVTIQKNFTACLITSITTSIGFYSLILQDIPPFQDLGLLAGTGTLYAFFASLYTMPALLAVLPVRAGRNVLEVKPAEDNPFYDKLEKWVHRHQAKIRTGSLVILAGSLFLIFQIVIDSAAVKYFKEGTEFRSAQVYIDENIIGTNPVEFNFDAGVENGVYAPEFLSKIEKFTNYIESRPELNITYSASIVDVVKRLNQTMNGNDPAFYKIPTKNKITVEGDTLYARKLISQYLLMYKLSLPQGMDLNNQLSLDDSKARVTAFMTSVSSAEQLKGIDELNQWLSKEMPEVKARGLGVPVMFGRMFLIAIPGMLKSLALSLILITMTMILTFRSIKVGLFSMIPNVWPILTLFGIIGLSGYVVNMSVAIVGMITLGIAVDDTVHFIVKYLMARRDGKDKDQAISWTMRQVGAPLFFTSIILIAGFGILMLSNFALNSDMGMFCSAIIALALVADFIVLPAFLLKFDKGKLI
jgi:hypothetical protein